MRILAGDLTTVPGRRKGVAPVYEKEWKAMAKKPEIILNPLTNRGTAFTHAQRARIGLTGRLPSAVETLDQQAGRAWKQLERYETDLEKYVFLDQLHDRNEVLYFRLLVDHLAELLPIVYDPTVGEAIEKWSQDYRRSRAVYLSIDRPEDVEASFDTLGLGPDDVDLIVVSDAEAILGIGDWGVNGTDISVGKLAVYTAAAGVDPSRVIAVNLDVGTDNERLLNDPFYLGNRHARVRGEAYDDFVELYLQTAAKLYPRALLHFEDFGAANARRILVNHREEYRIFNDDMQGTGAIVMAAVISGLKVTGESFADQRLVVFGAGTAGTGMADQIHAAMVHDGLDEADARARIWLVDRDGLVTDDMDALPDYQQAYARPASEVASWKRHRGRIELLDVVERVKPTILIGTSTLHNAFTEEVVTALARGVERPILLPLSNPTSRIEVSPEDAIRWSEGRAPGHRNPRAADRIRRHGLPHRPGQQRPAVPGPGARSDRRRSEPHNRRNAPRRRPSRGGPSRPDPSRGLAAPRRGGSARVLRDRGGRRHRGRPGRRRRHRRRRQSRPSGPGRHVAARLP